MTIDELTDEALHEAYQRNPSVRELVDGIQRKYGVHREQKGKPEYNEANIPLATKEIKDAVKKLMTQQKQASGIEGKTTTSSGIFAGRMENAAGLTAVLAGVAALSIGIPYTPLY
jgi:hypothetical protein